MTVEFRLPSAALEQIPWVHSDHFTACIGPLEESLREKQAWAFVDRKGDPRLVQRFLEHFPDGAHAAQAQTRAGELAGADAPDGDTRRPMLALAAVVAVLGGLLPAIRAARMPIVEAVRAS